jgi:tripeptide aminopeptidase
MRFALILSIPSLLALSGVAAAQDALVHRADVKRAIAYLAAHNDAHVRKQIAISEIPAPGWKEAPRAAFMQSEFKRVGLTDVEIDGIGNVLGWRRGQTPETLVIAAHTDTVFPAGTDVKVKAQGKRLNGPGLVDDARGLTCLLALAEALDEAHIATRRTLLFVANVGEEGLGNLRGTKYLFKESRFRDQLKAFITIDGLDETGITNGAIGSRRYRVKISGPGGHSWADWGIVNPAHAMGRMIADIGQLQVPASPKTTYNVGLVSGGTSINSVPFETSMEIDMRSESKAELDRLEASVLAAIQAGVERENQLRAASGTRLKVESVLVGDRPVGETPPDSALVVAAMWATRIVGRQPQLTWGSTDAGAPTSMGIAAIAIGGGGAGGNVHSLGEWFEPEDAYIGAQRALLTILAYDGSGPQKQGK